jgi:hypothetical protein
LIFDNALEHFFFRPSSSDSPSSDEITVTVEGLLAGISVALYLIIRFMPDCRFFAVVDCRAGDLLSSDSFRVESEDALLTQVLEFGSAYSSFFVTFGVSWSTPKELRLFPTVLHISM